MLQKIKVMFWGLAFPAILSGMSPALTVRAAARSESRLRIGKAIRLTASVDEASEPVWYRFRVRGPGEAAFQMVRDYGPEQDFRWAPMEKAGVYEIEITARGLRSGIISTAIHRQEVTAPLVDETPAVSPTEHPLVFLYTGPACATGSRMRVRFRSANTPEQLTVERECNGTSSLNFFLAGLRPDTVYSARYLLRRGDQFTEGPPVDFETPDVELALAPVTVLQPAPASESGMVLMGTLFQITTATDLQGNLVWYYPNDLQYLTRHTPGGFFLALLEKPTGTATEQRFIKFNLAGETVLETNAARINEQLAAMGMHPMTSFHHEARELPDGKFLLLAGTERMVTDVQGEGEVDVIGDMVLVLDTNLQVTWAWDAFDHMDVSRAAVGDEKCVPGGGGCPAFYLAPIANDWLHGNSLQLTPDGNILYSARHQDWLIKIDYENGKGNGDVLWRLGQDGDFTIDSTDPWPWFSHQHDGQIIWDKSANRVLVFDNGNTRRGLDPLANSRGQVFELDETNRTAKLVLNADLGAYALALGSAQLLPNGNYYFNLGWMPSTASQGLEYTPDGKLVYQVETGIQQYRSFRLTDLYTAPY